MNVSFSNLHTSEEAKFDISNLNRDIVLQKIILYYYYYYYYCYYNYQKMSVA